MCRGRNNQAGRPRESRPLAGSLKASQIQDENSLLRLLLPAIESFKSFVMAADDGDGGRAAVCLCGWFVLQKIKNPTFIPVFKAFSRIEFIRNINPDGNH